MKQNDIKLNLDLEKKSKLLSMCDENINSINQPAKVHYLRIKGILMNRCKKYCNGWLYTVPAVWAGTNIKKFAFRCLLKYHSGIKILKEESKCSECGKKSDVYGDHAISCGSTGQRIAKHDTLVKSLATTLNRAGILCSTELPADVQGDRMGDIVLFNWIECRDMFLDFSVINSLCPSYRSLSAKDPFSASNKRVSEKWDRYYKTVEDTKTMFTPVVVESLGGWHEDAVHLFKKFANSIANMKRSNEKDERNALMTSMSIRLQKMNGEMLALRMCH